ncbi:MAG: hypothetical protein JWR63_4465 [Conexibacter sp.]|nr:hypothetical protein [Conexibacter sp.]
MTVASSNGRWSVVPSLAPLTDAQRGRLGQIIAARRGMTRDSARILLRIAEGDERSAYSLTSGVAETNRAWLLRGGIIEEDEAGTRLTAMARFSLGLDDDPSSPA